VPQYPAHKTTSQVDPDCGAHALQFSLIQSEVRTHLFQLVKVDGLMKPSENAICSEDLGTFLETHTLS
jgi:hypothetical protein